MKIIGHRGAAGLALENTLPSIELARLLGVDAIEFDVRKTLDGHLVLCHDADLSRVSAHSDKIANLTFEKLQTLTLGDGQSKVPSLEEAIRMAGQTPVIIELKEDGCANELIQVLSGFPELIFTIVSFRLNQLAELRNKVPEMQLVGLERTKPFDIIQSARNLKLSGVGLNFWLLNPLTYLWVKRSGLSLYVFTINNRFVGKMISYFYTDAAICTDHPEWFIKHPWLRLKQNSKSWSNWPAREHDGESVEPDSKM